MTTAQPVPPTPAPVPPAPTDTPKTTDQWIRLIALLVASGLIGGGGGGVAGAYGATTLIEYRIERLEEDMVHHGESPHLSTQRAIDAVGAEVVRVDERRQSDVRLIESQYQQIDTRLQRIEDALETSARVRPRR